MFCLHLPGVNLVCFFTSNPSEPISDMSHIHIMLLGFIFCYNLSLFFSMGLFITQTFVALADTFVQNSVISMFPLVFNVA